MYMSRKNFVAKTLGDHVSNQLISEWETLTVHTLTLTVSRQNCENLYVKYHPSRKSDVYLHCNCHCDNMDFKLITTDRMRDVTDESCPNLDVSGRNGTAPTLYETCRFKHKMHP